jgi:hypothetical protein
MRRAQIDIRDPAVDIVAMEAEIAQKRDAVDPTHKHPIHQIIPPSSSGTSFDEKKDALTRVSSSQVYQPEDADDIVTPTEEEKRTLRRVAGHIPISAWLVVIVEFAERFSYYGTTGPFVNYMWAHLKLVDTTINSSYLCFQTEAFAYWGKWCWCACQRQQRNTRCTRKGATGVNRPYHL